MTFHVKQRVGRLLEHMGGIYTIEDLLARIADGRMQSFVAGNSWAVTQVAIFPRAKVLEIVALAGERDGFEELHERVLAYAQENDIGLISAYGRRGWIKEANRHGWKVKATNYLYHREL
jgi:hypothetical protein